MLLGFIYLTVFFSLLFQAQELIGSTGLLPVADLAGGGNLQFSQFPSLHIFFNSDLAIHFILILGMIAALALIWGYFPRIALLACILFFLSNVLHFFKM